MRAAIAADLPRLAHFAREVERADPAVESFGEGLGPLFRGPRALRQLWRVAEEDGRVVGAALAVLREPSVADVYGVVEPRARRSGLGRALLAPLLAWTEGRRSLRCALPEQAVAGRGFLAAAGFRERGRHAVLARTGAPGAEDRPLRKLAPDDVAALLPLCNAAWEGAPGSFETGAEDLAAALADPARELLAAEVEGRPVGYVRVLRLGDTRAIEELAVLPAWRRRGVGKALVSGALRGASAAVLQVHAANAAARAFYTALGFAEVGARIALERGP